MAVNRVRVRRDDMRLSQKELAAAIAVSRQSLNAIENGRTLPNVALALRLASVLNTSVEALFGAEANEELEALLGGSGRRVGMRVMLAVVRECWVAHPLGSDQEVPRQYAADGFVRRVLARRAVIELTRPQSELRDTLLIGGCAPGLSVLADRLGGASAGGRFRWLMQSNRVAMSALLKGHTHLAGVHVADEATHRLGAQVARYLPTPRGALYSFAKWEAGLVVPAGNPGRLSDVTALERPKLRVALREVGSGARTQLTRLMREAGLDVDDLAPRAVIAHDHMAVAQAVQLGLVDTGFSIRAAALAFGLDFIPLVDERFALIVPGDLGDDPRVLRLLEMLRNVNFRRELGELGYDARGAGEKLADVTAS
jgi:molybdate-binding protein/DNA-binding XRE family transcriptional regulator